MHRVVPATYEFVEFLDKILKVDFQQVQAPRPPSR